MKIIIIGPSWVGDMVIAQSLFKLLKQKSSNVQIDVMAPEWSQGILGRMPEVSNIVDMRLKHGKFEILTRRKIGKSLYLHNYDQAIVLPNSFKSALIPWFAKIKKRTGWRGEMRYGILNDIRVLNKNKYPLLVQRFAALAFDATHFPLMLEQIPFPSLWVNDANARAKAKKFKLDTQNVIALCPGAEFGITKQWPAEHFATVAKYAVSKGFKVWIFGSKNDSYIAQNIFTHCDVNDTVIKILAGETTLTDVLDLMSFVKMVITNDSGLMHIAAALNKPLIAIYGSSSPKFTPPLTSNAHILHTNIECRPCFSKKCSKKHLRCLTEITPDRVIEVLKKFRIGSEQ